ncbi:MAG: helix-hairpin-helix domain-containing protein [Bacilli bacterium]
MAAPGILCIIMVIYFLQQDRADDTELISTIPQQQTLADNETLQSEEPASAKAVVDVKGAVKFPGVYELTTEDRIIDAIQMAGGYSEEADSNYINHAQKLQDEMVIYIPKKGESLEGEGPSSVGPVFVQSQKTAGQKDPLVNINTADESQLTTLPGIGPSKAKAIIQYREENGKFKQIDELKNVSGIGEKTFEKLKDLITI